MPEPSPTGRSATSSTSKEEPRQRVRDRKRRTALDEQASDLLLAFARLVRGSRHDGGIPEHIGALLHSGELAPRHVGVFAVIALDGPMSVSALARREGVALSTASLLVTQLAEAGLVERHEDPEDRRRTVVSVAPEHRRESEEVLESKLAPLRRGLARMGPEAAAALLEGLGILAEEIGRGVSDVCPDGAAPGAVTPARTSGRRSGNTRSGGRPAFPAEPATATTSDGVTKKRQERRR
ncbi:MAG: MarR family winged helix-turn-helix transcriptional regulator [Acidimicrobiales bacterium]